MACRNSAAEMLGGHAADSRATPIAPAADVISGIWLVVILAVTVHILPLPSGNNQELRSN
jgi:hypothetical protein